MKEQQTVRQRTVNSEQLPGVRRIPITVLLGGFIPVVIGCHSVPPPVPLDRLNAQQARGYQVFQTRCAACHNDRTDDPLHGPALRGVYKKQYLPSGAPANDDRVTATVLHGRNLMPAQPGIDSQDMDDLLAYLHTL